MPRSSKASGVELKRSSVKVTVFSEDFAFPAASANVDQAPHPGSSRSRMPRFLAPQDFFSRVALRDAA
jgi:hypothetical protein